MVLDMKLYCVMVIIDLLLTFRVVSLGCNDSVISSLSASAVFCV